MGEGAFWGKTVPSSTPPPREKPYSGVDDRPRRCLKVGDIGTCRKRERMGAPPGMQGVFESCRRGWRALS